MIYGWIKKIKFVARNLLYNFYKGSNKPHKSTTDGTELELSFGQSKNEKEVLTIDSTLKNF